VPILFFRNPDLIVREDALAGDAPIDMLALIASEPPRRPTTMTAPEPQATAQRPSDVPGRDLGA
jgi:hypothetical protein